MKMFDKAPSVDEPTKASTAGIDFFNNQAKKAPKAKTKMKTKKASSSNDNNDNDGGDEDGNVSDSGAEEIISPALSSGSKEDDITDTAGAVEARKKLHISVRGFH